MRNDKAMEQQRASFINEEAHTVFDKSAECTYLPKMWRKETFSRALLDKEIIPEEGAAEARGKEQRPQEALDGIAAETTIAETPRGRGFVCVAQKGIAHSSALNVKI